MSHFFNKSDLVKTMRECHDLMTSGLHNPPNITELEWQQKWEKFESFVQGTFNFLLVNPIKGDDFFSMKEEAPQLAQSLSVPTLEQIFSFASWWMVTLLVPVSYFPDRSMDRMVFDEEGNSPVVPEEFSYNDPLGTNPKFVVSQLIRDEWRLRVTLTEPSGDIDEEEGREPYYLVDQQGLRSKEFIQTWLTKFISGYLWKVMDVDAAPALYEDDGDNAILNKGGANFRIINHLMQQVLRVFRHQTTPTGPGEMVLGLDANVITLGKHLDNEFSEVPKPEEVVQEPAEDIEQRNADWFKNVNADQLTKCILGDPETLAEFEKHLWAVPESGHLFGFTGDFPSVPAGHVYALHFLVGQNIWLMNALRVSDVGKEQVVALNNSLHSILASCHWPTLSGSDGGQFSTLVLLYLLSHHNWEGLNDENSRLADIKIVRDGELVSPMTLVGGASKAAELFQQIGALLNHIADMPNTDERALVVTDSGQVELLNIGTFQLMTYLKPENVVRLRSEVKVLEEVLTTMVESTLGVLERLENTKEDLHAMAIWIYVKDAIEKNIMMCWGMVTSAEALKARSDALMDTDTTWTVIHEKWQVQQKRFAELERQRNNLGKPQ